MLLRQAWRSWRSATGVALLVATALAIGIGSATAIYTVVNAVLLKPLPYRDGHRFVALFGAAANDPVHYSSLSMKDAQTYQERTRAFDAFGWFREAGQNLTFAGAPHHVQGVRVTTPLVRELGADPVLGQWFQDDSGVVISTSLWQRLGADPLIVGKSLSLDGRVYVVTGVMPPAFHLPVAGVTSAGFRTDVWMALDPKEDVGNAYFGYARRKPDVSFSAAEADVTRVAAEIAAEDPANRSGYTARLFDLRESVVKDVRPTLLLLLAAAGLLFLITCANTAGLLLARSVSRARETAIHVALGIGRWRLAATYFAESLLVALAGAAGGVLLSLTLTPVIVSVAADYLPRAEDIRVDWTVLLFALGAGLVASVLASLAPLWQAARTAPADVLRDGVRASASAHSRQVSQSLVVAEIALAFALLAAGASFVLQLRSLSRTTMGFDPDDLQTFVLSVPSTIARDSDRLVPHQQRLLDAVQAIPGVSDVAFANQLPLDGCCFGTDIYPEGRSSDLTSSQRTSLTMISTGYFRAMRIPLRSGRLLTDGDWFPEPKVMAVVISETAARLYWGGPSPLEAYGRFGNPKGPRFQVVGVVGDVKNDGPGNPSVPEFYLPVFLTRTETMNVVVRSQRTEASLVPDIRRVVLGIDAEQPIHEVATMRAIVRRATTLERASSLLTSFFAGAALLLAMLGVYGVVSYAVRQRTVEIGTRMAIGATERDVVRLIVGGGLRMAAYGVLAGGIAALAASFYLSQIFKMEASAPAALFYATSIVAFVAVAASILPAWRAALVSPMVAIRNEPGSIWQAGRRRVRHAVRGIAAGARRAAVPLAALITDVSGSVRRADSFSEAVRTALATLQERTGARFVMLLRQTGEDYRGESFSLPGRGFLLNRLRNYPHPLALDEADFQAWLRWAGQFKPEHVTEIERIRDSGTRMAVPLRTRSEIVGLLLLGAPAGDGSYTNEDKQALSNAADLFALMIENARLSDRALEQEKLRRDLALAGEVQRRLLPPRPPKNGMATLSAYSLPARTVGGDYYDFIDLPGDRLAVAIADVSGKGIAAALLMSVVQASLRALSSEQNLPPARLCGKMNGFLYRSTGTSKYATFFYAVIEAPGRRLRYVNAGHNPPYLARRAETGVEIAELSAGGTVLGMFDEVDYAEAELDLRPGDLIVAFTDGVTEALNPAGEEFGEARLKELLGAAIGLPAETVSAKLAETMRDWIGPAEQHDDLTFVVIAMN
jgi:putative ABC transport system permease protein